MYGMGCMFLNIFIIFYVDAHGRLLCGENKISGTIMGWFIIGIASLILLPFIDRAYIPQAVIL
jgi:hypothetical protein